MRADAAAGAGAAAPVPRRFRPLDPPGPVVLKVVPPTWVMFVLSDGNGTPPVKASESPLALKNDWPCAAIC